MKHFLELASVPTAELHDLLDLALRLKREWKAGGNSPLLQGKTLGMIFLKPSLRTRVSFEMAMKHLGGGAIMLGPQEIGLGVRESIPDVARVLSGYVDGIMARVFDHKDVVQLAEYASVPVINGLSDGYHPCQALGDMLTIHEHFGALDGLRLAFVGDGNNVAASVALACAHFGVSFSIATPEGYEMQRPVREQAYDIAGRNGSVLEMRTRPQLAVGKLAGAPFPQCFEQAGLVGCDDEFFEAQGREFELLNSSNRKGIQQSDIRATCAYKGGRERFGKVFQRIDC